MDQSNEIKSRFAKEAASYREEAPLVNFDFEDLTKILLWITNKIYPDNRVKIKILDIGAGNGMLSEILLKSYPNAEITLLDFAPEMLTSAKVYFEETNIPNKNIKYIVRDFIRDSLPNESYDLVISSYALHHIRSDEELRQVFSKIASVLKPNTGTFICIDMFLENLDDGRKRQVQKALDKWVELFASKEEANNWGKIIQSEDTPATIPTIIASLYQARANENVIPLLTNQGGDIATIYGMTKMSLEDIKRCGLYDLVWSWRDNKYPIGVSGLEYKIDNLQFDKVNDNQDDIKRL